MKAFTQEKIIQVISNIAPLTKKEIAAFQRLTRTIVLEKGDFWIEADKMNRQIGFVEKGYLRSYYLRDGKEMTDSFYFEDDFTADLPSILGTTPPAANIIAMENSTLVIFSYDEFNKLCSSVPHFEHLYRLLIELTFLRFYDRTISFIRETPKERYERLLSSQPKIFQRVTQYHIASYLGITPQHLSRIRSKR